MTPSPEWGEETLFAQPPAKCWHNTATQGATRCFKSETGSGCLLRTSVSLSYLVNRHIHEQFQGENEFIWERNIGAVMASEMFSPQGKRASDKFGFELWTESFSCHESVQCTPRDSEETIQRKLSNGAYRGSFKTLWLSIADERNSVSTSSLAVHLASSRGLRLSKGD